MDLLSTLARERHRLLKSERPEYRCVEGERRAEVAADQVDVTEAAQRHYAGTAVLRSSATTAGRISCRSPKIA